MFSLTFFLLIRFIIFTASQSFGLETKQRWRTNDGICSYFRSSFRYERLVVAERDYGVLYL